MDHTRTLEAHKGPVYAVEFNRDASFIASGGDDKQMIIWDTNSISENDANECTFYNETVHKSAITSIKWSNLEENALFTASADTKVFAFDLIKGQKFKTFNHPQCINQIDVSKRDIISTVSDDGKLRLFDMRSKDSIGEISTPYPLFTTVIDPTETFVYFSGIDPTVSCYDIRKLETPNWTESLQKRSVTSLSMSSNGEYLISKSIDGSIKYFNSINAGSSKSRAKPYVLEGPLANDEDWLIRSTIINSGNEMYTVISGSNDGLLYSWDLATRKIKSKLNYNCGSIFDLDSKLGKLVTSCENGSVVLSSL